MWTSVEMTTCGRILRSWIISRRLLTDVYKEPRTGLGTHRVLIPSEV